MQTLELINFGSKVLKEKLIPSYKLDSELLLASVLGKKREQMLVSINENVSKKNIESFNSLIRRRSRSEPIAYILNKKEFWSKNFIVDKKTLIPRPETELIVEYISKHFLNKNLHIFDIGTGSGCILLSLLSELKKSKGIGIDISKNAIKVARKNSRNLGLSTKSKFYNRSLDKIFAYKFDLIISNPPYICSSQIKNLSEDIKRYEPRIALDGGKDGLDVIKKVIYKSKSILKKKGLLVLEIGNGQYRKVSQILKFNNFRDRFLIKDYRNNIRCIISILDKWLDLLLFLNRHMNNQKRRFRPRQQKNNYRRRSSNGLQNNGGHYPNNVGNNFNRNGSMNNPFSVEKAIQKYQQMAKDALSAGDQVLSENYLQHADYYGRRLSELNLKFKENNPQKNINKESNLENNKISNKPENV